MKFCIGLIDDDKRLGEMLGHYLQSEGFESRLARDGTGGLSLALSGETDLVVLDIMLPDQSGIEVLKKIRTHSDIPVIMLTGRGDDLDRILGLELGADDYVAKPCTPRELVARIRAILKRISPSTPSAEVLREDDLLVRPGERRAELSGTTLRLTSTEFSILEMLIRNAGRTVSRDQLSSSALGRKLSRFDRSIDMHISSLRHKLGKRSDDLHWIETVVRHGYMLVRR